MKEKIALIKQKLTECGILEAQESNTAYEQAEREDKVFKKEDDKSFIEANRVLKLLQYFVELDEESDIPPTSIIREFIGGSRIVD